MSCIYHYSFKWANSNKTGNSSIFINTWATCNRLFMSTKAPCMSRENVRGFFYLLLVNGIENLLTQCISSVSFYSTFSTTNYDHKLWSQTMISNYDHKLWSQTMISNYDLKLWSQTMITNYDLKLWFQTMISNYDLKLWSQTMISNYDFKLWFQTMITNYDLKLWFQTMISNYDFKRWFQTMILNWREMLSVTLNHCTSLSSTTLRINVHE